MMYLTQAEALAITNFQFENPSIGYYLFTDYDSGIGRNLNIVTNEQYWKLRKEFGEGPIPYVFYNKVSKDITDYGSW